MKRIVFAIFMFSLAACGGNDASESTTTADSSLLSTDLVTNPGPGN
jgi:hypothetical protein